MARRSRLPSISAPFWGLLLLMIFVVLPERQPLLQNGGGFGAEALIRLAKKIAGEQWRNGSHELGRLIGRSHHEIKGLLVMKSPAFQERYKQLAEEYANLLEARTNDSGTNRALERQIEQVRGEALALLRVIFGLRSDAGKGAVPPHTSAAVRGGGADVVLDPIQGHLLALQQRQEEQKRLLLSQLEEAQRSERDAVQHKLAEARARHLEVQRQSQALQIIIVDLRKALEEISRRLALLSGAGLSIDHLGAKIEAALQAVSSTRIELGAGLTIPPAFLSLQSEAEASKSAMGRALGDLNQLFQSVSERIEDAEQRARSIGPIGGVTARAVSGENLQTIASVRLALETLEQTLRELVGSLERKQLGCDASAQKLREVVEELYERVAQGVCEAATQLEQRAESLSESLVSSILGGADQLKHQLSADLDAAASGHAAWPVLAASLQSLKTRYPTWDAGVESALNSFDGLLEAYRNLEQSGRALPDRYRGQIASCQAGLQGSLEKVLDAQSRLRQERAKVQHLVVSLEARYRDGLRRLLEPAAQQQQGLDPYASDGLAGFTPPVWSQTALSATPSAPHAAAAPPFPFPPGVMAQPGVGFRGTQHQQQPFPSLGGAGLPSFNPAAAPVF